MVILPVLKCWLRWIAYAYRVVKNQHCQSTLLGGREGFTKRRTLCMLLIMMTIIYSVAHLSRPLVWPSPLLFVPDGWREGRCDALHGHAIVTAGSSSVVPQQLTHGLLLNLNTNTLHCKKTHITHHYKTLHTITTHYVTRQHITHNHRCQHHCIRVGNPAFLAPSRFPVKIPRFFFGVFQIDRAMHLFVLFCVFCLFGI